MPTADTEERLRSALAEIVSHVEPSDRWDDVAGAAEVTRPGGRSWRGWVLAAAAVVVLVVGVALAAGRGDDDVLVAGPVGDDAPVSAEAGGIIGAASTVREGDELCLVVGATAADGEPLRVEVPKDRRCLPASSVDGLVWTTGTVEGSDAVVFALLGGTDVASLSAALPAVAVGDATPGPNPLLVAVLPSGPADPCVVGTTVVTLSMQDGSQRSVPLAATEDCEQDGSTSSPPTSFPSTAEFDELCELLAGATDRDDVGSDQHVADLDRAVSLAPDIVRPEIEVLRDHVSDHVDPAEPATQQPKRWPSEVLVAVDRIRLFTEIGCPTGD